MNEDVAFKRSRVNLLIHKLNVNVYFQRMTYLIGGIVADSQMTNQRFTNKVNVKVYFLFVSVCGKGLKTKTCNILKEVFFGIFELM